MLLSRSTWACELKFPRLGHTFIRRRHAPRERVSWNYYNVAVLCWFYVTLHVSVWVEIKKTSKVRKYVIVTLHVSVWVEIQEDGIKREGLHSHAPRERVSWNTRKEKVENKLFRHAPRERVSWNMTRQKTLLRTGCHAPRERVSWNRNYDFSDDEIHSHAPRERVSWNFIQRLSRL